MPPETPVACAIFDSMQVALRQFEQELQKSSRLFAKLRRDSNPNAIFQDLRDFQPNGVDMLLQQSPSRVVEVRHEEVSVVLDHPVTLRDDAPVVCDGPVLQIIHAEQDCLWVDSVANVQVGSLITQLSQIGTHEDLSHMFLSTWSSMWERH